MKKLICLITAGCLVAIASPTQASHFRGGALVPEISASGLLTVNATSFWRKSANETPFVTSNLGNLVTQTTVTDGTDSRFDRVTSVHTLQLPAGAATISLNANSCCRIAANTNGGNWIESSWELDAAIAWNGASATKPIDFNFASIQPEVSRISAYTQGLNAVSPDGLGLSYNQNLNLNITAQPTPSFLVNSATGVMSIPASETPLVQDHQQLQNIGGDKAFSGNIVASNGSFVEFDWMFDGVDSALNNAPVVGDGALFGTPGDPFNFLYTRFDPDGDPVVFDPAGFFAILGPLPALAPLFDPLTGLFSWNSAGSVIGNYVFQVRGRDPGGLTDVGSLSINLSRIPPNGQVPEPTSVLTWAGLFGISYLPFRHRRRK